MTPATRDSITVVNRNGLPSHLDPKMKLKTIPLCVAAVIALGCAGQDKFASEKANSHHASGSRAAATSPAAETNNRDGIAKLVGGQATTMPRNVVKSGSMTMQVDSVDDAEGKARQTAESLGGRVDRITSADLASPLATMDMTLRIPVAKFEQAMEQLQKLGTRLAKSVEVEDVTTEIIDFNARLKTMRVQEQLVRTMLARAGTLQDTLTINNDLTRLRAEIEALDAKRRLLESQAAFSTLHLKLVQKSSAVAMASVDPNWFQTSWGQAWGAATSVFRLIVGALMWLVVFSPIWILTFVAAARLVRVLRKPAHPAQSVGL